VVSHIHAQENHPKFFLSFKLDSITSDYDYFSFDYCRGCMHGNVILAISSLG
jgi:hypothetical protein